MFDGESVLLLGRQGAIDKPLYINIRPNFRPIDSAEKVAMTKNNVNTLT